MGERSNLRQPKATARPADREVDLPARIAPSHYPTPAVDLPAETAPARAAGMASPERPRGHSFGRIAVRPARADAEGLTTPGIALPAAIRAGAEALSGVALGDVQVHYGSPAPAKLGAEAFARGAEIAVAPGQERHLPHEAWHVVQQRQGRVRPTLQFRGRDVNLDAGLEREAEVMGRQTLQASPATSTASGATGGQPAAAPPLAGPRPTAPRVTTPVIQGKFSDSEDVIGNVASWLADARPDLLAAFDTANRDPKQLGAVRNWLQGQGLSPQQIAQAIAGQAPTPQGTVPPPSLGFPPRTSFFPGSFFGPPTHGLPPQTSSFPGPFFGPPTHGFPPHSPAFFGPFPSLPSTVSKTPQASPSVPLGSSSGKLPVEKKHPRGDDSGLDDEEKSAKRARISSTGAKGGGSATMSADELKPVDKKPTFDFRGSGGPTGFGDIITTTVVSDRKSDERLEDDLMYDEDSFGLRSSKGSSESRDDFDNLDEVEQDEELGEIEPDVLDPLRKLQIISLEGEIQVLTEEFSHGGSKRRRPVEWKVPFAKWGAGAQGQGRTTPTPMSLYGPGKNQDSRAPDKGFDAEGKYQKGHMVPASSGAHDHYALTTPMEQYTNQVGAWKQTEEAINRILLKPNKSNQTSFPRSDDEGYADTPETSLALTIAGYYNSPKDEATGFVHIEAKYAGADGRIPSSYVVGLYGVDKKTPMLLHEFSEIDNQYSADRSRMPSEGLKKLFEAVDTKLAEMDKQAKQAMKNRKHTGSMDQWVPLPPETGDQGILHPPRGIPEEHLPRPHRSLDAMVDWLGKMGEEDLDKALEGLTDEERAVIEAVLVGPFGKSLPFSAAQRDLAERHARYLDPRGEDRFLSDTRADEATKIKPVPESEPGAAEKNTLIQEIYKDQHDELAHGEGVNRPEADHHVPSSTGSGTNFFSNLLWVSHAQNLSKKAQNKPVAITNPNSVVASKHGAAPEELPKEKDPGWEVPGQQKLSTITKGQASVKDVEQAGWEEWQAPLQGEIAESEDLQEWAELVKEDQYEATVEAAKKMVHPLRKSDFEKAVRALGPKAYFWQIEKLVKNYQKF